ncbi:CD225/dispanin family protein [Bergeyella sp. RCAD1439]|uniref:CD225/dispanin family protein n=1 Tax=Bergeyella anatis TaxID=3113737 RepID=UPI002E19826F|nr:CD225/dispanin family protein [Bergeyella sp. RCAD1439]
MENNTTQNTGANFNEMPPNNNLVYAILSTILCCPPMGIYAIIKATEVNSKWNAGDKAGAIASRAS